MQLLVSAGGRAKHYSGFDIYASIPELLRPFQLTANLVQMNYLVPEWMFRADSAETVAIETYGKKFVGLIDDPRRSNPRRYLKEEMVADVEEYYE